MKKLLVSIVMAIVTSSAAMADEEDSDESRYDRCISVRSVRSTDIINDNMIVFRMVGRKRYLNKFARRCYGLSREGRFTYESHMQRLCSGDHIKVFMDPGASIQAGSACRLSEFQLLTEREVEEIYPSRAETPEPEEVSPAEVEEIDTGEAEQN